MTGQDIRAIRYRLGMTQVEFAKHVGTDQTVVSAWETGKSKPSGPARKLISMLAEGPPHRIAEPEPEYDAG